MELDIYIPSLSLALEFNGSQHYLESQLFGSLDIQRSRDVDKRIMCNLLGITLLEIPYWWDYSLRR
jgi:hypothetical protein